jgi:hypothetical protein
MAGPPVTTYGDGLANWNLAHTCWNTSPRLRLDAQSFPQSAEVLRTLVGVAGDGGAEWGAALAARLSAAAPFGFPSRTPRHLATASASLVRF